MPAFVKTETISANTPISSTVTMLIFAAFEMEVDVENQEELKYIMQKLRAKKITSSCTRLINEK